MANVATRKRATITTDSGLTKGETFSSLRFFCSDLTWKRSTHTQTRSRIKHWRTQEQSQDTPSLLFPPPPLPGAHNRQDRRPFDTQEVYIWRGRRRKTYARNKTTKKKEKRKEKEERNSWLPIKNSETTGTFLPKPTV